MLERTVHEAQTHTQVTFAPSAEPAAGHVGIARDVNDWRPEGQLLTARRPDGTHAVQVELPKEQQVGLRYLAHGDYWFSEDDADAYDGRNSCLHG